jgi:predicted HTH transcriptional regulator
VQKSYLGAKPSFGDEKRLLEPGEKEVRNPAIAMAMRRIGMCEQAGTGLRMMHREWQALGHAAPVHANDRVHKAFETFLPESRADAEGVTPHVTPHETPHVTPHETPHVTPEVARLLGALNGRCTGTS